MRNFLAIISGIIAISASIPYVIDTIKKKTRPNVVTWFTWGSLSAITALAALSAGAIQTAIFAAGLALAGWWIVIAGIRSGTRRYTRFDVVCQVLAVIGIILWQLTKQPALAVVFVIISDLIGALPTYRHVWLHPKEETLSAFTLNFVADILVLISVASINFVSTAYPIYIALSSLSIMMLIVYCRRRSVEAII